MLLTSWRMFLIHDPEWRKPGRLSVFLTWVGLDWNSVEDKMARVFYCWAVGKALPFSIKPALTPPQCREKHLVTTGWKRNCRQAIYFSLTLGERNTLSLACGDKYFLYLPCFFYITMRGQSLSRMWLFADPMDSSLPGSSVHGIFSQARILSGLPFPTLGQGLLSSALNVFNRRHCCRYHYASMGPWVPGVGEDRPTAQGFRDLCHGTWDSDLLMETRQEPPTEPKEGKGSWWEFGLASGHGAWTEKVGVIRMEEKSLWTQRTPATYGDSSPVEKLCE